MTPKPPDPPELESVLSRRGERLAGREELAGDVGTRRYTRLRFASGGSAVLARYPAELTSACERFLASGRMLAEVGVRVPEVWAADCIAGWMLVEDLGAETLFEWGRGRPWEERAPFYRRAVEVIRKIQGVPPEPVAALSPALDRALLGRELELVRQAFLEPRGLAGQGELRRRFDRFLDDLCGRLGDEPTVPCHRDLMPRNLVPLSAEGEIGVLDHQDLRLGPRYYDLASLLNDSFFAPPELEEELLGSLAGGEAERLSYHRAVVQRTLKAVGTYADRGLPLHWALIPATLARALEHLSRLPEGESLAPELARLWHPVTERAAEPPGRDLLH